GAVLISLTGVFAHKNDWDKELWPWHISRPLIGIALGVVSVLILQAGILAVGSSPNTQSESNNTKPTNTSTPPASAGSQAPNPDSQPANTGSQPGNTGAQPANNNQPVNSNSTNGKPSNLLYYLIAFLVGYREETFR